MPEIIKRHAAKDFVACEKLDGSSATFYLKDGEFGVCSRNLDLKETEGNTFWAVFRRDGFDKKLQKLADACTSQNWAFQLELVGPGIQDNKYKLKQHEVYLFNIFNIDKQIYLDYSDIHHLCFTLNMKMVPFRAIGELLKDATVDSLVAMATNKSALADIQREGLVFRSVVEEQDEDLGRLSFKVINPEFLLKNNE